MLRKFEQRLIQVESWILVALVLLMLVLASYNIFYRNVLIPLQHSWATSGPPVQVEPPNVVEHSEHAGSVQAAENVDEYVGDFEAKQKIDEADAFAGDFAISDASPPSPGNKADADGAEEAFLGDFGAGGEEQRDEPMPTSPSVPEPEATLQVDKKIEGGPPLPGTLAAIGVAFIDAIKLDWIDIFLRQLVLWVSFFGAMIATTRGKHINIDALSRILSPSKQRIAAIVVQAGTWIVCFFLTIAGWKLVQASREFPYDIFPWAKEWAFQLIFPLGFGLISLHTGIRLFETLSSAPTKQGEAP